MLDILDLPDDKRLTAIRYQLLHRTPSAIIAARRFGGAHAVMLVHSFSSTGAWFDDFAAFADLTGAPAKKGSTLRVHAFHDVALHLGWVSDTPRPLDPAPPLGPPFDRAFALARGRRAALRRGAARAPRRPSLGQPASGVVADQIIVIATRVSWGFTGAGIAVLLVNLVVRIGYKGDRSDRVKVVAPSRATERHARPMGRSRRLTPG